MTGNWRRSVKVGDLVICSCETDTWYKGKVGMVIDFSLTNDPRVLYYNGKVVRLVESALEIIS